MLLAGHYAIYVQNWNSGVINRNQNADASTSPFTIGNFFSNAAGQTNYRHQFDYWTIQSDAPIYVNFDSFDTKNEDYVYIRCGNYNDIRCSKTSGNSDIYGLGCWGVEINDNTGNIKKQASGWQKRCSGSGSVCNHLCDTADTTNGKYYMSVHFYATSSNHDTGFSGQFYGIDASDCSACPAGKGKGPGNTLCVSNPVMR